MDRNQYDERLRANPRPVIVDFWAPWCGPCRAIRPHMKKLGESYAGRVDLWEVNADESPALLQSLRVYGIPTLIVYSGGKEITRHTGAGSPAALAGLFEAALTGVKPAPAGPAPFDRILRLAIGAILVGLSLYGRFAGWYLLLAALGAVVLFSAVYDRCPIYRAVSARIREVLEPGSRRQNES